MISLPFKEREHTRIISQQTKHLGPKQTQGNIQQIVTLTNILQLISTQIS
jgi:hypothetical protein